MIHSDSEILGCVCPNCSNRCTDCLGTNTVVSRDQLSKLAFDERFSAEQILQNFVDSFSEQEDYDDPFLESHEDFFDV